LPVSGRCRGLGLFEERFGAPSKCKQNTICESSVERAFREPLGANERGEHIGELIGRGRRDVARLS
jgi:hypothetical protein